MENKKKMQTVTHPLGGLGQYKYVVVLSRFEGRILLSRHKNRSTWETQGGHIEPRETPLDAAKRELYEESGALKFTIEPVFDYWSEYIGTDIGAAGVVFFADITELGDIPDSEMAEVRTFDALSAELTYPDITPALLARLLADRRADSIADV